VETEQFVSCDLYTYMQYTCWW